MSHPLTIELTDATYTALQRQAQAVSRTPADLAAAALEQRFSRNGQPATAAERIAARARFEGHFGAVNLGHATGVDNDGIDTDLARVYADSHEAE